MINEVHVFIQRGQGWEGDSLEKINAKDKESEEGGKTVMNREIRLKRQRGGGERLDRGRVQSSEQSHVQHFSIQASSRWESDPGTSMNNKSIEIEIPCHCWSCFLM